MQTINKNQPSLKTAAARVSAVGIAGNIFLSIFKAAAGILSGSGALISDSVHSAADVFSNIIVLIGIRLSAKKPDEKHPFGYERFEYIAAATLGIILLITGLFIGLGAIAQILSGDTHQTEAPEIYAVIAAAVSVIIKEFLFRFTKFYGAKFNSQALLADAYHHRSDVLATVGALIGFLFSRLGFPVMDKVASLVISVLIIKTAFDILRDALKGLNKSV